MRVWSLGQEYTLEEEMATHSSIFAWKIPWSEEPGGGGGGDSPKGHKQSDTTEQLSHQAIMVDTAAMLPEVFSWNAFNDPLSSLYLSTNSFLIKLYTMDYIICN